MDIDSSIKMGEKGSGMFGTLAGKIKENLWNVAKNVKKVGEDDPRRITHSAKVGLALTIVSLLYYFRPLYNGFGQSGMWAILTVVVVFEFSAGGTISKCINRGFATFIAGALGIAAERFASLCGEKGDPIVLGILVFLLAAGATFVRFFPLIKRRYDYGVLIFILTFSLVTVSGYRVEEILELAHQRISTILIGAATCMLISVFVRPVWAGEDLHDLIISNIEKLAISIQGFGGENGQVVVSHDVKAKSQDYKSVLGTKATEESLANFAWWEPGHGCFRFSHPWKQYLKIGALTRECASQIEVLHCLKYPHSKTQTGLQKIIITSCKRMSLETGKALKEISSSMRETTHLESAFETHIQNSKSAMNELASLLDNFSLNQIGGGDRGTFGEIVQAVAAASILAEIIKIVEKLSESANEVAKLAHFRPCSATTPPTDDKHHLQQQEKTHILLHLGSVKPVSDDVVVDHVIIPVRGTVSREEESGMGNREICAPNKPVFLCL